MTEKTFAGLTVVWADQMLEWVGDDESPVQPVRGLLAIEELASFFPEKVEMTVKRGWAKASDIERRRWLTALERVHGKARVAEILGADGDLQAPVMTVFGGTYNLVEQLNKDLQVDGARGMYFNPAGGEHSGQHDGIQVFNDAAWAAIRLAESGLRVVVLDWDAHHAHETQELLRDVEGVLTASVHARETSATTYSDLDQGFINICLEPGESDGGFIAGVGQAVSKIEDWIEDQGGADVLVFDMGTCALEGDDWGPLSISLPAMIFAARHVADLADTRQMSVLALGGGGHQAMDGTPTTWAYSLAMIASEQIMGPLRRAAQADGVDVQWRD